MFGLSPAESDNSEGDCVWAELTPGLEHYKYLTAKHHDDIGAEVAKLMIHRKEKVLAVFVIGSGLVEVRETNNPAGPGAVTTAVVVAGQDIHRQTCVAHLPVTLLDGRMVVAGEVRFGVAHGRFSIFDRFWEVFRRNEKNFAAYN